MEIKRKTLSPNSLHNSYIRGQHYNELKTDRSLYPNSKHPKNERAESINVAKELARIYNITDRTIRRNGEFAEAVNNLEKALGKEILKDIFELDQKTVKRLAQTLISSGIEETQEELDFIKNSNVRGLEAKIAKRLAKKEGGKSEVPTPAGIIDVLTIRHVIEVKSFENWKHALGQVLVYGDYYPHHQCRIHLFGKTGKARDNYLEVIRFHCERREVLLTWEK